MSKRTHFRTALCCSVVAGALLSGTATADAQTVLRLGHLNPQDPHSNSSAAMAQVFKETVESRTGGEIEVQIYPDGQLGEDSEVIQQVRNNVVQSSISSVGGVAAHYPRIGVLDVPFAFPDISVTYEVMDGSFGDMLAQDIEDETGMMVLEFGDSGGFFAFTNSVQPIEALEDMEGMRIRTMEVATHEAMISGLGAEPTSLPWGEVYTALQTGVADGQMNPLPIIAFANFQEVQEYLTLSEHLWTPYPWLMNREFFDGLSDEHQQIIRYAARNANVAGRGISRLVETGELGIPALVEGGMELNTFDEEQRQAFASAAQPAVMEAIESEFGERGVELMEAFLEAIEEAAEQQ